MATTYGEAYFHVVFQPDFEENNNLNQVGRALSMELSWKYCAVSDRFLFLRQFRAVNILISYFRIPLNQTNMKRFSPLMLLSGMFLAAQAQTAQEPTAEEKAWMAYMTPVRCTKCWRMPMVSGQKK